jgi:U2-associated protein SR140
MAFALEHADAAETVRINSAPAVIRSSPLTNKMLMNRQIATLIVESLTIDSTPIPRKLARLHLLSDLLHNASSSLPNAWIYRSTFSALLPIVFTHLGIIFLAINKEGRIKGEWFRLRIVGVIEVWETWCVLGEGETEELIKLLSGGKNLDREGRETIINEEEEVVVVVEEREVVKKSSGFKKTGFQPAMLNAILPDAIPKEVEYDEDLDGDSMIVEEVVKEENIADDDVDGEDLITPQQPFSIKVNSVKVVEVADDDRMMLGDSDDDIF